MKLFVGLGNPGKKYANNRHNVGHMLVDYLRENINKPNFAFEKTDEFMNTSGRGVVRLLQKYKVSLDNLYIVHDDLDINLGEYKLHKARGPKLHNGVESVEKYLNSTDFWRVRVGVDNRDPDNRIPGEVYVLNDFTAGEAKTLEQVFSEILTEINNL